jgi:lipopolysaccharide biosynthesis protein
MNPISVFKIGKPKNEDNEDVIFNKMTDILDENDMDSLMEDEDEDGIDLIYVAITEEKRKKLVNLFEEYDVLLHHETFIIKQKP